MAQHFEGKILDVRLHDGLSKIGIIALLEHC